MTAADTAAVMATIAAAGALNGNVFMSKTPDGYARTVPYVLVHPTQGVDEQTRFSGPQITFHPEFTLHLCGTSPTSAQTVLELVKAKFVTSGFVVAPTVSGRVAKNAYWRQLLPIQLDTNVTPSIPYAVVELGWTSDPA